MGKATWSKEQEKLLKELVLENTPYSEITKILNMDLSRYKIIA